MLTKGQNQVCKRCIMDTTTSLIKFNDEGICNFCVENDRIKASFNFKDKGHLKSNFDKLISEIKERGANEKYDSLIGISGGFDSTYVTYIAKKNGLRPLLVHFDNGWNTNEATLNINNIVKNSGFDLYTYVINWEQFKDLQIAYFKASVIDIEVPTDQLIFAALYDVAKKYNIKSILTGENVYTETIMPRDWAFEHKLDYTNLVNIHKAYGKSKLVNFPKLSLSYQQKLTRLGFKKYSLITYCPFNYHELVNEMNDVFGWKNPEDKHFESVFTRFYQGYILPKKFNVDKRKVHYSNLINSGFLTRDEAFDKMKNPPYSLQMQNEDLEYILKKWDMSLEEFEVIMKKPEVNHDVFGYDKESKFEKLIEYLKLVYKFKIAYPLGIEKRPVS
ncbi:MAG: N-acetyl sugar amidotransferase [Bacteroidota bacterium]|jgi:N-acetyl sugar amidotransferase